ncbi:hypothetical protein TEA_017679 [Camellia sinensis var. sinensis]|uniref:Uncharacterized protein n=1 Tax=Camellia sinensis var. sinensis TaxID=542762 RepID=A0A4S4DUU8_CAMSN|nr:hypothetical protein TEA_017679 [Camellia sinensis var. sinensis]
MMSRSGSSRTVTLPRVTDRPQQTAATPGAPLVEDQIREYRQGQRARFVRERKAKKLFQRFRGRQPTSNTLEQQIAPETQLQLSMAERANATKIKQDTMEAIEFAAAYEMMTEDFGNTEIQDDSSSESSQDRQKQKKKQKKKKRAICKHCYPEEEYKEFEAVQVIKLVPHARIPFRATTGSVGYDLSAIAKYSVVLETFCYDPKWMLCASDDIFSSAPSMILAFENPHAGLVGNWGVPASTSMRLRKPSLNPLYLQSIHLHLWLQ